MWRLFSREQSAHSRTFDSRTANAGADPDRAGLQLLGVIFGCVTATVTMLAIVAVIQQA
jgi:hypothetical protein